MIVTPGEHDDSIADALALVHAVREEETGDVAVLLRHANMYATGLVMAKLLAELLDEQEVCTEHWRIWAEQAARRP
jgi:hypothetical protein